MIEALFALLGLLWLLFWVHMAYQDHVKSTKKDDLLEQFYKNTPGQSDPNAEGTRLIVRNSYRSGATPWADPEAGFNGGLILAMVIIIGMISLSFWLKSRG